MGDLLKEYELFAPAKREKLVFFDRINSAAEIYFDFSNTLRPPKDLFFPQSEVLFTFQGPDKDTKNHLADTKNRVLFGIRPCDARSLLLLDKIFDSQDYQDPYYIEKRKKSILVGMGCVHPQSTCFCTSLGGDPFGETCLDILMVNIKDGKYFAKGITEKGKALIRKSNIFQDTEETDEEAVAKIKKEAEEKLKSKLSIEGLNEKLDKMFDSPFWDNVHQRCLGCAICTYLCPTCHCFALLDEKVGFKGKRIRNWDSCMFPEFTLEASGHNPRASNKERMRQRIMHKFNYFVGNFGETACIGCGRCIHNCPVNMDIREIIEEVKNDQSLPS